MIKRGALFIQLVFASVLFAGCCNTHPSSTDASETKSRFDHAEGQLSVEGAKSGPLQFKVNKCCSGETFQFFGAELFQDPKNDSERDQNAHAKLRRIRVVDDPVQGYQVVLLNVLEEPARVVLNQASCTVFDPLVRLGERLNDLRSVVGWVRLDCSVFGLHITGDLKFSECFHWVGRPESGEASQPAKH